MLEHPEAERADPYEKDVERVWRDSGKVYGARKIRHALEHEGVTLSRRRVNRIMKRNGMAGSYSKAAYRPSTALDWPATARTERARGPSDRLG